MDFTGKTVLITGGCSGIGKIMARKSLERNIAKLVILDINAEALAETQQEFQKYRKDINVFTCDLSVKEEIIRVCEQIKIRTGIPDIIINNAGVVTGKYFHQHTHENIQKSMAVNAAAPMHLTVEFLPEMMTRNSGAVCTIASSAGLISNPKMSVYAASKWAATGWSDSLRLEMHQLHKNISFTTIMPFYINTGMFAGVKSKLLPILDPEKTSEKIIRAIETEKKLVAMPLPYWFIRLNQGILPVPVFDWVMEHIFGIYNTMRDFRGRH